MDLRYQKLPSLEKLGKRIKLDTSGIPDTGCSALCCGLDMMRRLKLPRSALVKTTVSMKVADGKAVMVVGGFPVIVERADDETCQVTQFLHVVEELSHLYLSKSCLKALGVISKSFPFPEKSEERLQEVKMSSLAPCG